VVGNQVYNVNELNRQWDVIVIGGGPAGATCATVLADHGRSVLLLEKGRFPRHHIGESLMPQTYWTFKRIGMLDKLKASDFPRKESVQFVTASGKESEPYYFTDRDPNEWSTTWQVPRDVFDQMMLDNARQHGVIVRQGVRVSEVLFEGQRAVGVRAAAAPRDTPAAAAELDHRASSCSLSEPRASARADTPLGTRPRIAHGDIEAGAVGQNAGAVGQDVSMATPCESRGHTSVGESARAEARGSLEAPNRAVRSSDSGRPAEEPFDLRAKVVVDATGLSALMSKQLRLRATDPALKNGAIYAYFRGARVDEGRNAGATIIIHTPDREGWFWFIPLAGGVTSIGLVGPPSFLFTGRGDDPLNTLEAEIARCPHVTERLARATRVSGAYVTSDFSSHASRMCGDGWVLIGDAFEFIDPVYSSGVMLALTSGEWAADAIHAALEAGDASAARLGPYEARFRHGVEMIRRLVYRFYDRDFSFGRFIAAHPEHKDHLVRLLIGDVFNDEVGSIFDAMSRFDKTCGQCCGGAAGTHP